MRNKAILTVLGLLGLGVTAQATTMTFTFLENGYNKDLGGSSVFTEGGDTVYAYANSGQDIYAKSSGGGEVGLGIASDPSNTHEIWGPNFVQVYAPGLSILSFEIENNNPLLDNANIFISTTQGVLGTLLAGPLGGLYNVPLADQTGYYIGIQSYKTDGSTDTWIGSMVVGGVAAPDGGYTLGLLSAGLVGLVGIDMIRRKRLPVRVSVK